MDSLQSTEIIFLLLMTFVVGFGAIARLIQLPYPIVLVVAGLLLSLAPGLPLVTLDPELIFVAVLPPLLFSAAIETPWREFRKNLTIIFSLAFGLVAFTVLGVAGAAHMLLPRFDWRLGLVLGAVVAPTDAIAATAIAKRLGLPKRIIDLLEGESLINDASGLLALEFATSIVVGAQTPTVGYAAWRLVVLLVGGVGLGLLIAKLVDVVERKIDAPPIEVTLSLVTPYLVYIGAEAVGGSGVLAVVAAGLYLGVRRSDAISSAVRIEGRGFWDTFTFVLNGLVFLMIGLQLRYILSSIRRISPTELMIDAAEFVVVVILLRLIWVYPGAAVASWVSTKLLKREEEKLSPAATFLVGWTGMRGVISLAAAIALPQYLENGLPFPQRNVIIFLTFCIIFATLVLQGLTLPAVIRRLGLVQVSRKAAEERRARKMVLEAGVQRVEQLHGSHPDGLASLYDDVVQMYRRRIAHLSTGGQQTEDEADEEALRRRDFFLHIGQEARLAERRKAQELRRDHAIDDELYQVLERELDLLDLHFTRD